MKDDKHWDAAKKAIPVIVILLIFVGIFLTQEKGFDVKYSFDSETKIFTIRPGRRVTSIEVEQITANGVIECVDENDLVYKVNRNNGTDELLITYFDRDGEAHIFYFEIFNTCGTTLDTWVLEIKRNDIGKLCIDSEKFIIS